MIWFLILTQISCVLTQIGWVNSKLLFLQTIFRHGDRSPLINYPGDLTPPEFWPEGYGMLSKLGRKQHYFLGKYLRQMYKDFITTSPNEVLINSTDEERCLLSGLTHLSSFYAPDPEWTFESTFNWQPISVHYKPYNRDKYLSVYSECPRAFQEQERLYNTPEYLQLTEKYMPMLQTLSYYIGHIPNPKEAYDLYDAWFVERKYNLSLPYWAEIFFNQLQDFTQITGYQSFESPFIQRLRAGPIIGKMIVDLNKKIAGEIPFLKVQVYSSQDQHLIVIMKALGVFNNLPCPYCGTLIFELHELLDNSKAVRMLYLNSTTPEYGFQVPHVLTLERCFEYCPLDFFVNYTKHLIPQDWERECGLID